MLTTLSVVLIAAAVIGVAALSVQLVSTLRHLREQARAPQSAPGLSILKPLCGADDDLEKNLECFAALDYPEYEVVLGVKDTSDAAFPIALKACTRWPEKMRLVVQRGEPGFNPKVNQLVTLEAAARHDLVVVSDSNTRVDRGYLAEIAAHFEDPEVACVTHPVVGVGEQTLGSALDNLQLCSSVGPGMIAAKRVADQAIVVGKSMALRKSDLAALGGFWAMKDYLAEDYVIGRAVAGQLGKRVVVARGRVLNISQKKTVKDFFRRYARWSVIHHTAVSLPIFFGQAMLNPIPLAGLAVLLHPTLDMLAAAAAVVFGKLFIDSLAVRAMRGHGLGAGALAAVLLKDALLFGTWLSALFTDTVDWRGHQLRVCAGSRLVPLDAAEPKAADLAGAPPAA